MQEKDFERMTINPYSALKSDDLMKDFPILALNPVFQDCFNLIDKEHSEEGKKLSKKRIIAYVACVYDRQSPLVVIDDIIRRKGEAATISGFSKNTDTKYNPEYMKVIECRNPIVNSIIMAYLRTQGSLLFTQLCIYQDKIHNMLTQLHNSTDANEQKTTIANVKILKVEYDNVYSEYTAKDNNKLLNSDIIDEIEFETLNLRPEAVALQLQNKNEPVNYYPYKKKYNFDRYKE